MDEWCPPHFIHTNKDHPCFQSCHITKQEGKLRNKKRIGQLWLDTSDGVWDHFTLPLAARTPRSAQEVLPLAMRTPRMGISKDYEVTLLRDPTFHWVTQVHNNTRRKWYDLLINVSDPRSVLVMRWYIGWVPPISVLSPPKNVKSLKYVCTDLPYSEPGQ